MSPARLRGPPSGTKSDARTVTADLRDTFRQRNPTVAPVFSGWSTLYNLNDLYFAKWFFPIKTEVQWVPGRMRSPRRGKPRQVQTAVGNRTVAESGMAK